MNKPLSAAVQFTGPEANLIIRVIKDVRGPNKVVVPLSVLMQMIANAVKQSVEFSSADLGMIASVISNHQSFSVDDGPLLVALSGKLSKTLAELEAKANQPSEENNDSTQETPAGPEPKPEGSGE